MCSRCTTRARTPTGDVDEPKSKKVQQEHPRARTPTGSANKPKSKNVQQVHHQSKDTNRGRK